MIVAVADTHTAVWYLFNDPRLSPIALQFIEQAGQDGNHIGVSCITLAEMVYLSEKGRLQPSAVEDLIQALADPSNVLLELHVDALIVSKMREILRADIPDMPDRIVAATGLRFGVPIISRDGKIRTSGVRTIW